MKYVIYRTDTGEFAYYGEGWAFTTDFSMAIRYPTNQDAENALKRIQASDTYLAGLPFVVKPIPN